MLSPLLMLCEENPPATGVLTSQSAQQCAVCIFALSLAWKVLEETVELPVIWDATTLMWRHSNVNMARK